MPRKPRLLLDNGYYHLIARGNNRQFIFVEASAFLRFKELLLESKSKFSWKLLHYCLMSNHIHLLGQIHLGAELPRLMQFLLFEYSRWHKKQNHYSGHLWEGRYKSPLISKESYLLECGRYIERNPVRAGVVKIAEEYPWSSYSYYASAQKDLLVDEDPYYAGLGKDDETRRRNYKEFVKCDGPYDAILEESLLQSHF